MTFRMPAEWAPHDWVWIGFPTNPAEWPGAFDEARQQIADFATAVHADGRGEEVRLVVANEADAEIARKLAHTGVAIVVQTLGDVWLRDTAPIAVCDGQARALVDFGFNGWGGKYEMAGDEDIGARLAAMTGLPTDTQHWVLEGGAIDTDGTGLFVTTEQCLLNPNRNPDLDRGKIETLLAGSLGLSDMLWLGDGLLGDHTDGHVDNLARFVAPGILALPEAAGEDDPNAAIYADARARARAHGVDIVSIPSPGLVMVDGQPIPASYMNFYIGNAAVIVPVYGCPNDKAALEALKPFFPGRDIVGLPGNAILSGGGGFHCTSQQMPSR
ncbi:agmatine deiminase [Sphingobium wenxiniae]|uniref:Agmatine deiminase n=1 Tax=Sphingobium wenxiniae (strain DSM 21828 / CGMCC 1.7748 / JZ-1) TaxID=595605 RepID=A0A562KQ54_SPHWJ|nr:MULTISPECIES: agmatine deiminase family protein [Sphingobium]MBB6190270.1 agmatine deiminase [Sphingobium wenxiniae]TWH97415.1 agmatine deiminase [Sphingobium wenxiniae]WRD77538.1 agmatine deiminase family protein [Sphingobium baderi]